MSSTSTRSTKADYERMPEEVRCELIEGELVKMPSPEYRHQRVVGTLLLRLLELVGRDRVVHGPMDIELSEYTILQPDVMVFAAPLSPDQEKPMPLPAVVFEVLPPDTAKRDRGQTMRHYLNAGVREVWLVDSETGALDVHTAVVVTRYRPQDEAWSAVIPGFRATGRMLVR